MRESWNEVIQKETISKVKFSNLLQSYFLFCHSFLQMYFLKNYLPSPSDK